MSVALYMDVHVPRAITNALMTRGVDVLTAQDDLAEQMDDADLLDRAMQLNRVIVTQDDDFLVIASRRQKSGMSFAGVIFAHQQRCTVSQCIADLEIIAHVYDPPDIANRVEYLPL